MTTNPCAGSTGSIGNQTIAIKNVQVFFSQASADVSVTKSDSPDPVLLNGTLTYTITVKNNNSTADDRTVANGVAILDTIDPQTTFVPPDPGQSEYDFEPRLHALVGRGHLFDWVPERPADRHPNDCCARPSNRPHPPRERFRTGTCVASGNPARADLSQQSEPAIRRVRAGHALRIRTAPTDSSTSEPTNVLPTADLGDHEDDDDHDRRQGKHSHLHDNDHQYRPEQRGPVATVSDTFLTRRQVFEPVSGAARCRLWPRATLCGTPASGNTGNINNRAINPE